MRKNTANDDWIYNQLQRRREQDLERSLVLIEQPGIEISVNGRKLINFSSNDYLNLSKHPKLIAAAGDAARTYGSASSASRLMSGNLAIHQELEQKLAEYIGSEKTLLFSSGYLANIGAVTSLVGRHDFVLADKLVHASILDGVTLSGAKLQRFRHNDPSHLNELLQLLPRERPETRVLVVTESVFSMDGDIAPLKALVSIAKAHGAIVMVDEAHALGVFGPKGSGVVNMQELGSKVDIRTGTLSKSFASYGGFVACSAEFYQLLLNSARSFIYNTSLPPANVAVSLAALELITQQEVLGLELLRVADAFCDQLKRYNIVPLNTSSQIVPVPIGSASAALEVAQKVTAEGIFVQAMRPPTVPANSCRLRFSLTLGHEVSVLADVAQKVARVLGTV